MFFILGVTVFSLLQTGESLDVSTCDIGNLPLAVRIEGCTKTPCAFIRSQDTHFEVDFAVGKHLESLTVQVKAVALGVTTNYPLPQSNACLNMINGECPLEAGEEVTYKLIMPVLTSFPKVHFLVQFSLVSGEDVIMCFKMPGDVVDP